MRTLLCLILLVTCSLAAPAAPRVDNHGRHFSTADRKVVVTSSIPEDRQDIEQMLILHGAKIMQGFLAQLIYPHVSFKYTPSIRGSANAFSIHVSPGSVKILYTCPPMRDKAMEQFKTLFESPYGQRIIRGRNIELSVSKGTAKSAVKRSGDGVVDGVSRTLSVSEVCSAIKRNGAGDFVMAVVSHRIFRLNFDVFKGVDPKWGSIVVSGGYSFGQIAEMVAFAKNHNANFVPAIDLLSRNEPFEKYTGHKMNSVEGMRFVRAMVEQCVSEWGVTKICIGRKQDLPDERYMQFLKNLATAQGIELMEL